MFPCALCNDSDIQDGAVVGDPTEGALYVLAQKGGVDVRRVPREPPAHRIGAVRLRLQVHGHLPHDARGGRRPVVRAYVKGAPDVILDRSTFARMPGGRASGSPTTCGRRCWPRTSASPARAGASSPSPSASSTRHLRPLRRPDGADAGPGAGGTGRRGRPAARRGDGRHRRGQERRHPGADDHRGPRRSPRPRSPRSWASRGEP